MNTDEKRKQRWRRGEEREETNKNTENARLKPLISTDKRR